MSARTLSGRHGLWSSVRSPAPSAHKPSLSSPSPRSRSHIHPGARQHEDRPRDTLDPGPGGDGRRPGGRAGTGPRLRRPHGQLQRAARQRERAEGAQARRQAGREGQGARGEDRRGDAREVPGTRGPRAAGAADQDAGDQPGDERVDLEGGRRVPQARADHPPQADRLPGPRAAVASKIRMSRRSSTSPRPRSPISTPSSRRRGRR